MDESVIEEDLTIEGNLTAANSAVSVKGRIRGDVKAKTIDVLASGSVLGAVAADDVTVAGKLEGSVDCTLLSLQETSKVQANLSAKTLSVNSGATIAGRVDVKGS